MIFSCPLQGKVSISWWIICILFFYFIYCSSVHTFICAFWLFRFLSHFMKLLIEIFQSCQVTRLCNVHVHTWEWWPELFLAYIFWLEYNHMALSCFPRSWQFQCGLSFYEVMINKCYILTKMSSLKCMSTLGCKQDANKITTNF